MGREGPQVRGTRARSGPGGVGEAWGGEGSPWGPPAPLPPPLIPEEAEDPSVLREVVWGGAGWGVSYP